MIEPELDTPRLRLLPITYAVAAQVVAGDLSSVAAAPGWPHPDTLDALGPYVLAGDTEACGGWFIVSRADGTVIGDCGWRGGPNEDGDVEIGYGLAAPSRGHGFGGEAVGALVAWVSRQRGVQRILAEVLADNLPSRRLLERLGFTVGDPADPYVCYALPVRFAL